MKLLRALTFLAATATSFLSAVTELKGQTTVFSNFGPGKTYPPGTFGGWSVTGSDYGFTESAMAFTSSGDFILSQIDLAISSNAAGAALAGFDSAVLRLSSNNGGLPGATLMTWTLTGLPTYGTCCTVETVAPTSPVFLAAGKEYWLVASPATAATFAAWNVNGIGQIGPTIQTFTPDVFAVPSFSNEGAFDVLGTSTPEPSSGILFASSVLMLAVARTRRFNTEN